LSFGDLWWDDLLFDGVGMDAVVNLRQCALQVPFEGETPLLLGLQALKLKNQIVLKLRRKPCAKFKCNISMGKNATAITSSF
jgi:hypothetical protein